MDQRTLVISLFIITAVAVIGFALWQRRRADKAIESGETVRDALKRDMPTVRGEQ